MGPSPPALSFAATCSVLETIVVVVVVVVSAGFLGEDEDVGGALLPPVVVLEDGRSYFCPRTTSAVGFGANLSASLLLFLVAPAEKLS